MRGWAAAAPFAAGVSSAILNSCNHGQRIAQWPYISIKTVFNRAAPKPQCCRADREIDLTVKRRSGAAEENRTPDSIIANDRCFAQLCIISTKVVNKNSVLSALSVCAYPPSLQNFLVKLSKTKARLIPFDPAAHDVVRRGLPT